MAQLLQAPSMPSLAGLEEELTCSICLCVFESPVTTPCGHNFCLPCLEMTWADALGRFSCPQCRSTFLARPELKKNTVLCKVVEQFQGTQDGLPKEPEKGKGWGISSAPQVACDSCLEEEAAKTCLTCMASFCQEHLKPHLDSPAFKGHQLALPMKDLQQRKCLDHNKLLEFYCKDHACCICCFCFVKHKACAAVLMQEAKEEKEAQLKNRLTDLYGLTDKADLLLDQVRRQQNQANETANRKLHLLKSEFQEIIALIEEEQEESVKKVKEEDKRVQTKFDFVHRVLGKKKNEIKEERDKIEMTLTESDDLTFLKKAAKLRQLTIKDVYVPKTDLDQKLIHTIYQNVCGLKENVKQCLTRPAEKKTEANPMWKPKPFNQPPYAGKKNVAPDSPKGDGPPPKLPQEPDVEDGAKTKQRRRPAKRTPSPTQRTRSSSRNPPVSQSGTLETWLSKSREELLEFAAKFTLDFNTAHNKVVLLERNTKMAVSDTLQNYGHHPKRFSYCSQVLSFQCYKRGIHYWEVELEHHNFCGIGICYGTMARHGAESRLGRNSSSWCIEWFNSKISAWHNDVEKCLPNTKVKKVGVLLNYDGGFVIFFGVSEKVNLLYKFRAQFTEAVYAAFWVFSSGTTLSLCQLN